MTKKNETSLFQNDERAIGKMISRLASCNPFLPERIECEKELLGSEFIPVDRTWNMRADLEDKRPNVIRVAEKVEAFAEKLRNRLIDKVKASRDELVIYEDIVLFLLYHRYNEKFQELIDDGIEEKGAPKQIDFFSDFQREAKYFLDIRGLNLPGQHDIAHIFAFCYQIRRAFHHIFGFIVGGSMASARLRASVWESVFTHDMRRYINHLYKIMGDITTLITGPSGTGKELVAKAIAMSRYIPYQEKTKRFAEELGSLFLPLNISALSPTLVESELFGHKKGAFTGALQDRAGWLEACSSLGSVFLDEIGEVDPSIQVKLLRVMQERSFQRLGETKEIKFMGKIIAATNRNLAEEMDEGNFRQDFYYRLCSDIVTTPSLYEQLQESPEELNNLVLFLVKRHIKYDSELLAKEVVTWIKKELGPDYSWPGNIRELEQCIRNVMIRNEYHPPMLKEATDSKSQLAEELISGSLTADELLSRYCTLVYSQTGSYQETARKLGLDRRTVKSRVDK